MKRLTTAVNVRTLRYAMLGVALSGATSSLAAVSQSPLSLTVGVPPNMLLTLDDSGSMRWGFAPDGLSDESATRRAKSSAYNPIYYNPNATYAAPVVFDTSGNEQQLATTFTQAWHNGFRTSVGSANLSGAGYRVAWDVPITTVPGSASYNYGDVSNYAQPTGTVSRLADNPSADFSATIGLGILFPTPVNSPGGIQFTITPILVGVLGCTAVASYPGIFSGLTADCSRTASGYTASLVRRPVPAYYYIYDSSRANSCTTGNDNCYALRFVASNEQANFANWYSFYRNRALSTISAAALAFYNLSPSVRLSWQGLGRCTTFDGSDTTYCRNNAFKAYTPAHKGQLYAWLQNIAFDQSTYLPAAMKRAGEFYRTTVPWQAFPNATGTNTIQNTYACRASYHIMMTDGQWNEAVTAPSNFRHDAASFTLPDGRAFTQRAPYYDSTPNTLADLAMHYWATDLNPNLGNSLPAYLPFKSGDTTADYWNPRNDPATWQHMTNFTMGLGLTQSLTQSNIPWGGSTFAGSGYSALEAGAAWPAAAANATDANVYDLWHAAINSRGEFFSVDSPEAMVQAFSDILSRIADRKSSAARPAINSGQVSPDEGTTQTVSYQTSYASDDNWSGDVKRFEKRWNPQTNAIDTVEVWSAKAKVPAWAQRRIKIAAPATASNNGLQDLTSANASLSQYAGTTLLAYLARNPETGLVDNLAASRVDYLRGNRAGEGTTLRRRSGLLGDFYSSSPAVVSGARYLEQFSNRLEGNTAYTTFKAAIANRTPRIYVGGNAGMLHGFNALTGVEEFAFIPSAVFSKLHKLTGSNYSHEFYVDGSPVVGDVYDNATRQWRTILVGTLKAGGKSIFALDVTTPGSEKLLWQFDENSIAATTAVKMGYSYSQPTIARLHNGKWAVVFGNGYESAGNTNGKAALFIVDAMQGTLLRSLEVQGAVGLANGLSTPKLADYNADGVADYAYAGDLQGNMWRFDLLRSGRNSSNPFTTTDDSDTAVSEFKVGFGGNPLFRATADNAGTQRQAITSAPSLVAHPTGTGYLVVFGTGRFFDSDDKDGDKSMPQSVYGIWDKQTLGEVASNPNINRSSLQQQSITNTLVGTATDGSTRQARVISNNSIRWQATNNLAAQNGWYLNLVQSDGEMVVENMSQLGRTLTFQSLVPNSDPCGDGASNWSYAINPFTGGRTNQRAFDYSPSSNIGTGVISGVSQGGEGGGSLSQNPDGGYQYCTGQECVTIYPDPSSVGRQSWRRIEQLQ
ncbi:PilC/PilY family type IV pilus protein [Pseudomonas sp. MGal98]|uniref:pilus assembly protein n=1 Tax=Pseudomonas sp. MGal98 TaxID=3162460 RepID=UPI0032EE69E7